MPHTKHVQIKPTITAKEIGCPINHFNIHIKGEALRVIEETRTEYTVRDGADHQWILKKTDVTIMR